MGDENRGTSAAIGGALGTLSPIAGNVVDEVLGGARRVAGYVLGTKPRSARVVQDIIDDSTLTDSQIAREAQRLGPEASLADITGQSGLAHGQKLVTKRPEAQAYVEKVMTDRAAGAGDRITKAMYGTLDEQIGSDQVVKMLNKRASERASPVYRQAFDEDIIDLSKMDFTPAQLKELNSLKGHATKIMATNGADPNTASRTEYLHWLKDALNDNIKSNTDQFGKVNALGRGYSQMAGKLDDALKANPTYKEAAGIWAGEQKLKEAALAGRKALNPDLRKTIQQVREMSPDEKTVYGASLLETMHNQSKRRPLGSASNFNSLEKQNFKDVADEVLDPDRIRVIDDMVDAERRYAKAESKLLGGAQSAFRMDEHNIQQGWLDTVINWVKGVQGKLTDDEAMAVTQLLVTPGGALDAVEFARSKRGWEPLTDALTDIFRYSGPVLAGQAGAEYSQ
jgi:hypothetical protein